VDTLCREQLRYQKEVQKKLEWFATMSKEQSEELAILREAKGIDEATISMLEAERNAFASESSILKARVGEADEVRDKLVRMEAAGIAAVEAREEEAERSSDRVITGLTARLETAVEILRAQKKKIGLLERSTKEEKVISERSKEVVKNFSVQISLLQRKIKVSGNEHEKYRKREAGLLARIQQMEMKQEQERELNSNSNSISNANSTRVVEQQLHEGEEPEKEEREKEKGAVDKESSSAIGYRSEMTSTATNIHVF
jgi:hypothetical protein